MRSAAVHIWSDHSSVFHPHADYRHGLSSREETENGIDSSPSCRRFHLQTNRLAWASAGAGVERHAQNASAARAGETIDGMREAGSETGFHFCNRHGLRGCHGSRRHDKQLPLRRSTPASSFLLHTAVAWRACVLVVCRLVFMLSHGD